MYSVDEEASEEENIEEVLVNKEAQDYSRPFNPPQGTKDTIPKDHPDLDTDADNDEWYDAGRDATAGAHDPGNRGIRGYRPKNHEPPKNGPVKTRKLHKAG